MSERFFIKTTPAMRDALDHLAIDLDAQAEKLAGILLAPAVTQAVSDFKAGKLKRGQFNIPRRKGAK